MSSEEKGFDSYLKYKNLSEGKYKSQVLSTLEQIPEHDPIWIEIGRDIAKKYGKRLRDRMDLNKDGKLTFGEISKYIFGILGGAIGSVITYLITILV